MHEAENTGVEPEVALPEAEATEPVQNYSTEPAQEIAQEEVSDKERNFRTLRENFEQLQRERQRDLEERAQERAQLFRFQEELLKQRQVPQEPEIDELEDLGAEDWITREKGEKLFTRIAQQAAADALEKDRVKRAEDKAKKDQEEAPERLMKRFKDFHNVVTPQTVEQLQTLEPELAQALSLITDLEKRGVAAYKFITKFVPQVQQSLATKQRLEENQNQPKSMSSASGRSPLTQAASFEGRMTPELQKQLWAEMNNASRG